MLALENGGQQPPEKSRSIFLKDICSPMNGPAEEAIALGSLALLCNDLAQCMVSIGSLDFAPAFAAFLQQAGGYQSTVIAAFPVTGRPIRLFSNLAPDDEETTARPYFDKSYLLDPWYNMAQSNVADGVYRFGDHVPDDFKESEYYEQYYAATGLTDEAGLFVRLTPSLCIIAMLGNRGGETPAGDLRHLSAFHPCTVELMRKHWAGLSTLATTPEDNLATMCKDKGLAKREIEVTIFLLRGYSNKMIGRELGISPETVKVYRKRINRKLGTSSSREVFAAFFGKDMHS